MRTIRYLLLLLLCGSAGAGWSAEARPNLLANGSFEEGLADWTVAVTDPAEVGAAAVPDGSQARSGTASLRCTVAARAEVTVTAATKALEGGQDYLFTCWRRSEGPGQEDEVLPRPTYTLTWLGADGNPVGSVRGIMPYAAGTDWQITVRVLTAPAQAVSARVSFHLAADEGTPLKSLWLDQVQLRRWPGEVNPEGGSWRYEVWSGYSMTKVTRVVADDMTKSGLAVIANTRFVDRPTYLSAFLYLRDLPPGTYRAVHRLKVAAVPPDAHVATLTSEYGGGGVPNSRDLMGGDFVQAGVYQDFSLRFVVTPWTGYVGLGCFWHAAVTAWADTITIFEEETYSDELVEALFG